MALQHVVIVFPCISNPFFSICRRFALLSLDTTAATGFQGDFSSVTVHTLGEQTGGTGRIQEGVDLIADGGTINVADGTYTESVVIDSKGMTLTGESQAGVIVQATTTADALVNGPSSSNVFSVGYNDSTGTAGKDILIQQMTIQNGAYGIRSKAGDTSVIDTTVRHNGWNGQGLPADKLSLIHI